MKRLTFSASILALAATLLVPSAYAGPITVPTGLQPADHYQLAFVTAGARDALSPNIADYNAFVTAQANLSPDLAALATTWRAIAYAANGPSGEVNAQIVGPVFGLDGLLVANDANQLFAGPWRAGGYWFHPIAHDQFGTHPQVDYVWTGKGMPLGGGSEVAENLRTATYAYSPSPQLAYAYSYEINPFPLFAVSGDLIVPGAPVPEPASLLLLGTGLVGLARWRRRRR